jgi:hypothetical protein
MDVAACQPVDNNADSVPPLSRFVRKLVRLFRHGGKALLVTRGVLWEPEVRDATLTVHEIERAHITFLKKLLDRVRTRKIIGHTAGHSVEVLA